ncbi:MAG TPA: RHS repeat-associated core domain-containing protein [Terriglobales bacterium]|nr:RHS repeat-associated core domain-containing protein [Terriglobales bacterium]
MIWRYNWNTNTVNTVTDPSGHYTIHTFTNMGGTCSLYETLRQSYDRSGKLLKTVQTDYRVFNNPYDANSASAVPTRITTTLDNGQQSKIERTYDPGFNNGAYIFGNVMTETEWDFGNSTVLRFTKKTYKALDDPSYRSANLLDLVSSVLVAGSTTALPNSCTMDAASSRCSYTTYGYDESTLDPSYIVSSSLNLNHVGKRGNRTSVRQWRNGAEYARTFHVFNDAGMLTRTTDPGGHSTSYAYGAEYQGAYVTQTTLPPTAVKGQQINHVSTKTYDFNTGLVLTSRDENNQPTQYDYDVFRRTRHIYAANQGTTAFDYAEFSPECSAQSPAACPGVLITRDLSDNGSPEPLQFRAVVDGLGRLTQTQLLSDPQGTVFQNTRYYPVGNVMCSSNPYRSGETVYETCSEYDGLRRKTKVKPTDAAATSNYMSISYVGNKVTTTDQANAQRATYNDALGRLIRVDEPGPISLANPAVTEYTYDPLSNLVAVIQKGASAPSSEWRTRTFTYDSLSRLREAINPESGKIIYDYDPDNNLVSRSSPKPNQYDSAQRQTITYAYDSLHRMCGKIYGPSTLTCEQSDLFNVEYIFDIGNALGTANTIGRRTGMRDASGTTAWSYDEMGNIVAERRTIGGNTKDSAFTYYLDGSLKTLSYPVNLSNANERRRTVTYNMDSAARTYAVSNSDGTSYATVSNFSPHGAALDYRYGSNIRLTNSYNSRLQPLLSEARQIVPVDTPDGIIFSRAYDFQLGIKDNGNVYGVTDGLDAKGIPNRPNGSMRYTYDALNRISTAITPGNDCTLLQPSNVTRDWGDSYQIDIWGNLTGISVIKCSSFPLNQPVNSRNQLTGLNRHDAAGNLTENGLYAYDPENRLSSSGSTSYTYDGDGQRVMKAPGKAYWSAAALPGAVTETDSAGNIMSDYVFFNGRRIARLDLSTPPRYYISDHLGSTSLVTSEVGAVLSESHYHPFGRERVVKADDPNAYKFTGKERDSETGLDYFGARYYGSNMGRMLSPDPLNIFGLKPEQFERFIADPQHWNKYAYVLNNPLRFTDPLGLLEYQAALLDKKIRIHIDDHLSDKQQQALKGKLDAAISNINQNAEKLTSQQKSVLGNIKSIDVDGTAKRSFVIESKGAFTLSVGDVQKSSKAYLGSAIGHDGFHIQLFKIGGIGASRGNDGERRATEFQIDFGKRIGLTPGEVNYLKDFRDNIEKHSDYFNSPVK